MAAKKAKKAKSKLRKAKSIGKVKTLRMLADESPKET